MPKAILKSDLKSKLLSQINNVFLELANAIRNGFYTLLGATFVVEHSGCSNSFDNWTKTLFDFL
jgi:hypothetical protein